MVIKPTYDDANLILRLYEMRREERMRTAREWFGQNFHFHTIEEFNRGCPQGSSMNAYVRMVTSYWEMVASFITGGILNQELFFQSGMELLFVWERIRPLVPEMREASKNPTHLQNLEKVAMAYIEWLNSRAPEAHATFAARIG
jgi:Domain of unknown function (DUF4760)